MSLQRVFLVEGIRTPFQLSGTGYKELSAYHLASLVLKKLIDKVDIPKIDNVIFGNVIQDSKTSNISREACLLSGLDVTVPAHTVTMACISSNKAITDCVNELKLNNSNVSIAGGVETMSDLPIKVSKPMRKILFESRKWKNIQDTLSGISKFNLMDLGIEIPSISEFSTNETMGYSADKLTHIWNVSRKDQDEFALRSHMMASKASLENKLSDVVTVNVPEIIKLDNLIKHDSSFEKLSTLKPAFIKNFGNITAGNSSSLTDGASACLLVNEDGMNQYGLSPKCEIIDYIYYGTQPSNELLLGPAYATSKLLNKHNLTKDDINVFEIHEAFAGQVLANLNALASEKFSEKNNFKTIGEIPIEKINNWGGSLSLGHPFGATGVRLISMAANRLNECDGTYGLITACAAGGLGHAMLIKNYK